MKTCHACVFSFSLNAGCMVLNSPCDPCEMHDHAPREGECRVDPAAHTGFIRRVDVHPRERSVTRKSRSGESRRVRLHIVFIAREHLAFSCEIDVV